LIFSLYVNDLEDYMVLNGYKGLDIGFKLFLLLYADDIVILVTNDPFSNKGY